MFPLPTMQLQQSVLQDSLYKLCVLQTMLCIYKQHSKLRLYFQPIFRSLLCRLDQFLIQRSYAKGKHTAVSLCRKFQGKSVYAEDQMS